jgi:uncharacterized protein (DUF2267 family)
MVTVLGCRPGTLDAGALTMMTGFEVFDRTVQKSLEWIDAVADALHADRHHGYAALRAVLHALRDRLGVAEAVELAAQMPMLVRGMYFEGWSPQRRPARIKRYDQLLDTVRAELAPGTSAAYARDAVTAVFHVLDEHISAGEMADVRQALPRRLRDAWPVG